MMGIVFRLWAMGLQAGVLICIILAVRFCLKKYPKIYSYSLWALAGIRLLCPFWIESPFSLLPGLSFAQYEETVQGTVMPGQAVPGAQPVQLSGDKGQTATPVTKDPAQSVQQDTSVPAEGHAAGQSGNADGMQKEKTSPFTEIRNLLSSQKTVSEVLKLSAVLYLAVTICFLVFYMIQYAWMRHKLSAAVWEQDNIWLDSEIRSPFVMGLISPKIYLPYSISDDRFFHDSSFIDNIDASCNGFHMAEKEWILKHEQTHIRHHDPLIRMAGFL